MNVIDVTIVGGPDLAAVVSRTGPPGATVLDVAVANDGPVPARLVRVVVPIETSTVRSVVSHGWGSADPGYDGAPAAGTSGPVLVADGQAVGWLGATRHRGDVAIQRDGWLITATAEMGGVLLAPGERTALDRLWLGGAEDDFAAAWSRHQGPVRVLDDTVGAVVAAGARPAAIEAAVSQVGAAATGGAPGAGTTERVLVAAGTGDIDAVAAAASSTGAGWGVVVALWGSQERPVDPSRPGGLAAMQALGVRLAQLDVPYVVVTGAEQALRRPRWGDAAATPVASLRAGLVALRQGLGPSAVLHLAGGPPAALAGVADIIDVGPGWPARDATSAVARRAALHGVVWTASPGPLAHDTPPDVLEELARVSGPRLLWPGGARPAPAAGTGPPGS